MKAALKSWLKSVGWYEQASRAWMWAEPRLTNSVRLVTRKNARLARRYLATHSTTGLQIGCGSNPLEGWLNTDLVPRGDQIYLDATRRFPFPAEAFTYVYSEHMIEHIPFPAAAFMLRECYRVMKPGGVIRIVTPNMEFLRTLLPPGPPATLDAYMTFHQREHNIPGPSGSGIHTFNHFMRAWGHQFIYDEPSLIALLESTGFVGAARCELQQSADARLRGLAKEDRVPPGFHAMESLTVEARKPSR
jgi:predicted SAM-dependent methyltransferase